MKHYKVMAVWVILYPSVIRKVSRQDRELIPSSEMRLLRSILEFTIVDREKNNNIRKELNIPPLNETINENKSNWCDHFGRMLHDTLLMSSVDYRPEGKRDIGAWWK